MRNSIEERFWPKVHKTENCWFWIGGLDSSGYGCFSVNFSEIPCKTSSRGRWASMKLAHRVAWFLVCGRWPDGRLLHSCDNTQCVRPEHLLKGTQKKNMQDAGVKGRLG